MDKKDRREYWKEYNRAHREERKASQKAYHQAYYQAHKEEAKAYMKAYNQAHKEEAKAYQKAYKKAHVNSFGKTLNSVRVMSRHYLFNVLKHTKIDGYEIHHCFGYEDYKKFIYIPRELHLQIHKFLRDNGIDADSDHYQQIEHLIVNYNSSKEMHVLVLR